MEKGMQPAAEKPKDYSLFAEEFKKDLLIVKDLEMRLAERWKFVEAEEAAGRQETADKIRIEIEAIEEELLSARQSAEMDVVRHSHVTRGLERMGPDDFPGHA